MPPSMKAGVCLVAFCDLAPFIAAVSAEMADSGAVAERYRHAFGGLSVRFFVGQSVRNPADSAEFLAHSAGTEAHLFLDRFARQRERHDHCYGARRIGLRPSEARHGGHHGRPRGQMQKSAARKFHCVPLNHLAMKV